MQHLKQFINISLDTQYKSESGNRSACHSPLNNKLHLLYLSLTSKGDHSTQNHGHGKPYPNCAQQKYRSEPNLHVPTHPSGDKYHKWMDLDGLVYVSNAESEARSAEDETSDESGHEDSEHGAEFVIAGHGDTTIVHDDTDTEHTEHDEAHHMAFNNDLLSVLSAGDIKESEPESTPASSHYMSDHSDPQSIECDVTHMAQIGSKRGVVVKAQCIENHVLAVQLLNTNVDRMAISKLKLVFDKNCIGITSSTSDIALPSQIKYNHGFGFMCSLELDANCVDDTVTFDDAVDLVLNTNLFEIKCQMQIPIHAFFEAKHEVTRDT
eukprot:269071_1